MLRMVLRKMLNNPWLIICLLVGSILAVAMISSVPIYTDGVLQRMLIKDLEEYQLETENYPGCYYVNGIFNYYYSEEIRMQAYRAFDKRITTELVKEVDLPILRAVKNLTLAQLFTHPEVQREEESKKRDIKVDTVTNIDEYITIINGRMYTTAKDQGYYEVIVTEEAMKNLDLRLNEIYLTNHLFEDYLAEPNGPLRFKVVGVFGIEESMQDAFWFQGLSSYKSSFLMDYNLFNDVFVNTDSPLLTNVQWYIAFDYHKMNLTNIKTLLETYEKQSRYYSHYRSLDWHFPAISILEQYTRREAQLKLTLWILQVPILIMLVFYLFMVSQLIVEREKNEIAVLKSRGASSVQIFIAYFIESLILSGFALFLGPPLGLLLCSIIGSSNGFLEFVQRSALPLSLSTKAYTYSLWAILLFIVTMLVPAVIASRTTIVIYKQSKTRATKTSLWRKYFLDILLLAIAGYGIYSYQARQTFMGLMGTDAVKVAADPLLFLISTLFIIGVGLAFLRIYPYLVTFIFWLGRKVWSPVLYASFIQVGRSGGQNQFLMLFIIVTLSIGIFNANAARTINSNLEERIHYQMGSDLIINPYWPSNEIPEMPEIPIGGPSRAIPISREPVQYQEPPFASFRDLQGVENATKVFSKDKVSVSLMDQRSDDVYLMGIIPDEFGTMISFRQDLLKPYHINNYLNLLSYDPKAVLLSTSFKEKYNIKLGDSIFITWGRQGQMEGVVYAFVDYWPTFNPLAHKESAISPHLVVANYHYIRTMMALEPYEIWLQKKADVTSLVIYTQIEEKGLQITNLKDTSQIIISMKNDPMIQGTNGALTLGFIVTMTISIIGFLIFWIISIQNRVLNFGIFRAMGLSRGKVLGMLVWEQLLISGVAVFIGILVGGVVSNLFVPMLQLAQSVTQQILPFKVDAYRGDYIKIYSVVAFMLSLGLLVLAAIINKIKIAQAIKLGED